MSPIQGYRHPWVMNKREFLEAYNRIMDNMAPTDTIPDDRIRISSILSNITSVIGPVALAMSFIPGVSIIGAADKLIGIAATVTGLPQTAYDHFENKNFFYN